MFKLQHLFRRCAFKTCSSFSNHLRIFQNNNIIFHKSFCNQSNESQTQIIDFNTITNGDEELEHKLKVIMLEAEVLRQEGRLVPPNSSFTAEHWKDALNLKSKSARMRYFEFLFKKFKRKENEKEKKLKKQLEREEWKSKGKEPCSESIEEFAQKYDLQHNTILMRVRDTTINHFYNNRLIRAIQFGQKLVIDCGYENNMTKRENLLCAKQLMLLFSENRQHDDPFDLHICNLNQEGELFKNLVKFIPTINEPSFPLNVHEGSYLDIFPKDQLVYLTPHCRNEITEYDHDAVYIMGGIVDKVNNEPLSLAKAKREGLKMGKLPLDRYLQWGCGSGKSLTLNHVTSILLDAKSTNDWAYALRHVPKRKIVENKQEESRFSYESRIIKNKFNRKWVPASLVNIDKVKGFKKLNKF